MQTGSIYALIDPRDNAVRYVGQTICALKKRLGDHLSYPTNTTIAEWFAELRTLGMRPVIDLLETVNACDIDEREQYWIIEMSARGKLFNRRIAHEPLRGLTVRIPYALMHEVREIALNKQMSINDVLIVMLRKGLKAIEAFDSAGAI